MQPRRIDVLLVEDDADDVAVIDHFLAQSRPGEPAFRLTAVERLEGAQRALAGRRFHVALLDLFLPGSSGIEGLLRLRECRADLPVVLLTGLRDEELALKAVSLGAQDYLIKGAIDERLLKRALSYAIERGRLLARVEQLLAQDADGKVVVDGEGKARYANPAALALLGLPEKEVVGRRLGFSARPGETREVDLARPGEPARVAEVRVTEIDWLEGRAALATLRDVTPKYQLARLEAEVKERLSVVDLKNEFMTSISHELRNPLTTVKTAVQSLKEGLVGPLSPQQMRFVELAYRNVERQIRIINNVLDLARLQSGRARPDRRRLALSPIVGEVVQAYALGSGAPRLEVSVAERLPDLYADPDLVTQVLTNLIDNAMRFAREKVSLRVLPAAPTEEGRWEARPFGAEGGAIVTVADDGPGLSESSLARLFTRFVQISRSSGGGGYKGTGLGLAICKEIVTAHGGRIWAESEAGNGARFHCAWPAFLPRGEEAPPPSQDVEIPFTPRR